MMQYMMRSEEAYCRFCEMQLPEWTSAYSSMPRGEPLMTISHNGKIFLITGEHTLTQAKRRCSTPAYIRTIVESPTQLEIPFKDLCSHFHHPSYARHCLSMCYSCIWQWTQ